MSTSPSDELVMRTACFEDRLALGLEPEPLAVAGYLLISFIGKGSYGRVYRARDTKLERDIALKLTKAKSDERDLAEARSLAAVQHPHVVRVHAVEIVDGHVATAMELVEGQRFDKWMMTKPRVDDVLRVLHQAGEGLCAIHRAGLVHRDIKPSNILVDRDGNAKIVDLGLAKAEGPVGTEKWGAPEVRSGSRPDHRSDQYSFALVVRSALEQAGPVHLANKFIDKALRKLPGARWPSLAEGLVMLPHHHPRRGRLVLAIAVLVGIAIGLALRQDDPKRGDLPSVDMAGLATAADATRRVQAANDEQEAYDGWRDGYDALARWPWIAGLWSEQMATQMGTETTQAWVLVDAAESYEAAGTWQDAARARETASGVWMAAGQDIEANKQLECAAENAAGRPCR